MQSIEDDLERTSQKYVDEKKYAFIPSNSGFIPFYSVFFFSYRNLEEELDQLTNSKVPFSDIFAESVKQTHIHTLIFTFLTFFKQEKKRKERQVVLEEKTGTLKSEIEELRRQLEAKEKEFNELNAELIQSSKQTNQQPINKFLHLHFNFIFMKKRTTRTLTSALRSPRPSTPTGRTRSTSFFLRSTSGKRKSSRPSGSGTGTSALPRPSGTSTGWPGTSSSRTSWRPRKCTRPCAPSATLWRARRPA